MVSLKLIVLLGLISLAMTQDYDGDDDDDDDDFAAASGDQVGGPAGSYENYSPYGGSVFGQPNYDDSAAAASQIRPSLVEALKPEAGKKVKRSVESGGKSGHNDLLHKSLIRVRRGGHYGGVAGPVYTYIKTDHHGHFKWGARHNVGKHYG